MSRDVLQSPEIVRRTKKILALRKEERRAVKKLGMIVADIGDQLIAVKGSLDRTDDKTAWLRWLKKRVDYTRFTANNYMKIARLRKKMLKRFNIFSHFDVTCLYRVASLPDEVIDKLDPDTRLTDPKTGEAKALKDMSSRELDRALDALDGKKEKTRKEPERFIDTHGPPANLGAPVGDSQEAFAVSARARLQQFIRSLDAIYALKKDLKGPTKQGVIVTVEELRRAILKWQAWAVPVKRGESALMK